MNAESTPVAGSTSSDPANATHDDAPSQTGDLVIDAALTDLGSTAPGDLDGLIVAGERVQSTLQARLADLGS